MKPYDVGLICGRFQTFHKGHEKLVDTGLMLCDRLLILIGSAQECGTERNPLNINTRTKMLKVIREHIEESKLYKECMDRVDKFHFDSQKIAMLNGANSHQEKADELAEIMNEGISPYVWYYYEAMDGYIVYLYKT